MNLSKLFENERFFTATVLGIVVLVVALIDNFYLTWAFLGAVYIIAFLEAQKLFGIEDKRLVVYAIAIWLSASIFSNSSDLFVLAGVIYASILAYKRDVEWKNFLPFIYPTAGMLFILTLYQNYGIFSLVWLFVIVALTDIGAYAVGKSIGKTPFSQTSPNKTLEGVVGGLVVATVGGMFMGLTLVDIDQSFIVAFLVSVSAVFGDLYESYLKRKAGVKDSGNILPGHGGMLDRIDGYLFASIVMLVFLRGLV
ncbi:MAG: CDP-archaeol synthase [Sulfurimonas sp.]|jgi:phosphatidate cytidylyltransferase|nr:CDP-archaeol synthase [Sulfurimonadaceae bacterium]